MCIRYTAARLEVARAVPVPALSGPPHLAAGAASALALTLFNAVQPTLGTPRQIGPGTLKDVLLTLVPTAATPWGGLPGAAAPGAAAPAAGTGSGKAAPAGGRGRCRCR